MRTRKNTLGRTENNIAKQKLKQLSVLLHDLRVKNNTLRNQFDKNDPFEGGKIAGYKPKMKFSNAKTLFLSQLERYKKLQLSDDAMVDRLIDCYNIIADRWLNSSERPDEVTIIMELAFDWYFNFYWKTPERQAKFLTAWRRYMQVGRPTPLMMKFANATVDGQLDQEGLLNGLGALGALSLSRWGYYLEVNGVRMSLKRARVYAARNNADIVAYLKRNPIVKRRFKHNEYDLSTLTSDEICDGLLVAEYAIVSGSVNMQEYNYEKNYYGEYSNSWVFIGKRKYYYTFANGILDIIRYD